MGLESGDELILEVREREIALKVLGKIAKPTEEFYGSLRKRMDAVRAIRRFSRHSHVRDSHLQQS
jgi:hypothetical protein